MLCKVYRKATSLKELEQRAALEEVSRASYGGAVSATSSDQEEVPKIGYDEVIMETEEEFETTLQTEILSSSRPQTKPVLESVETYRRAQVTLESSAAQVPSNLSAKTPASKPPTNLLALQVPNQASFDWVQDPFLSQLRSPWLDQWSPLYANLLNF